MVSHAQLLLGAPLFCFALIIARGKYDSTVECVRIEPPRLQTVRKFTTCNCTGSARISRRKREAIAAMQIVLNLFQRSGMQAPAGVCPPGSGPGSVDKMSGWLRCLAAIYPAEAMQILAENIRTVPSQHLSAVETEYNTAAAARGLAQLVQGELAYRLHNLELQLALPEHVQTAVNAGVQPAAPRGRFYYIAAGVGCGIREMEQVRPACLL